MKTLIAGLGALLLLSTAPFAVAQETTDSADVWVAVEAQWNAEEDGDKRWADKMLLDDFVGWSKDVPAPRTKESIKYWDRFADKMGKTVAHELFPLSITINGDVAIAHYLYSSAYENKDGDIEMNSGRFTDVLLRTEDGWKFIAWHGGDDD